MSLSGSLVVIATIVLVESIMGHPSSYEGQDCNCQNTGWPGTTFACGSNGVNYYDYQATCMSQCASIGIYYAGTCGTIRYSVAPGTYHGSGCPNDCYSSLGNDLVGEVLIVLLSYVHSILALAKMTLTTDISGRDACLCNAGYTLDDCSATQYDLPVLPQLYGNNMPERTDELFNDTTIAVVRLYLDPADYEWLVMPSNAENSSYKKGGLWFNNQNYNANLSEIGIRLHGSATRRNVKKSWRTKFDKFSDQKLLGYKEVAFISSLQDPSFIHQKTNYDMFYAMGVSTSRASFAALYINDIYMGLYMVMEVVDSEFTKANWGDKDGNLYKCSYADLEYLGSDPNIYRNLSDGDEYKLDMQSNVYTPYEDLVQLIETLNMTDEADFIANWPAIFDSDSHLREVVVEVSTGDHDAYGFSANNFILYHSTSTQVFEYVPYDTDLSWGLDNHGLDMASINVYSWGNHSEGKFRGLVTRPLHTPPFRSTYTSCFKTFLTEIFNPDSALTERVSYFQLPAVQMDQMQVFDHQYTYEDFLSSLTEPIVHWDPTNKVNVTVNPYSIKKFLQTRYNTAMEQLDTL